MINFIIVDKFRSKKLKKNKKLELASVILYFNTPKKTKKCLEACFNSIAIDQQIILVDNNSLISPIEDLLSKIELPDNLIVIKNKSNIGFSAGVNVGIKYALENFNPKYISIINSDLYVEKNALYLALKKLNNLKGILPIGALTAKILFEDKKYIWQAGGYINLLTMSGIPTGLNKKDSEEFSKPSLTGWASGAFSIFPSEVLKDVGLFSEDFFFGQEEWDLSLRLIKKGYQIYYDPDVIATHSVGGSYKKSHPVLNTFNGYCNKVIMAKKHFSKTKYLIWLSIFEIRTFLISIPLSIKHSNSFEDIFIQLKAIYLSLLFSPFINKTDNKLLRKTSKLIGVSKTWPNYWGTNNKKGTIVVHSGRRDNYQVATALYKNNSLKFLITDFYLPDNKYLRRCLLLFSGILPRIKNRSQGELPSSKVIFSKTALFFSMISRIFKNLRIVNHFEEIHDYFLARKANKLALKYDCNIISYSTYASRSFKNIKNKKILYQMHPYVDYIRKRLSKEHKNNPLPKSTLSEYEFRIYKKTLINLRKEPYLSDYIICPSKFCQSTLPKLSKEIEQICLPYGTRIKSNKYKIRNNSKFQVLFIGSLCQRKGVSYFLEVADHLKNKQIDFKIITRSIEDQYLNKKALKMKNVEIIFDANNEELEEILSDSHIFLFPSLIEGFGHVILETMSFGMVPIVSPYSIGPEIIKDSHNGYVLEPKDKLNISDKINSLFENKKLFNRISKNSYKSSNLFTEKLFQENFTNFMKEYIY